MTIDYGVLRGRVDLFEREERGDTPHLQIRVVDAGGGPWRVPVSVASGDGSRAIFHRADPLLSHPIVEGLRGYGPGFTNIPPESRMASTALDFFRAPLFDWMTGVEISHTGPGPSDDLQDILTGYLGQLRDQRGEIFAFGSMYPVSGRKFDSKRIDRRFQTRRGVHEVHMNQGSANPGPFAQCNGVFQDGGLILAFPSRCVGLFVRFSSQWLPTNDRTGHRLRGASPIPPGHAPVGTLADGDGKGPGPVARPAVYIERALVDPVGGDVGKEIVVIGNASSAPVNVANWRIVDKNGAFDVLAGPPLAPGESRAITLTGAGAQLGNEGGTIALKNASGKQIHAVAYSKADARPEGRYVRFKT